MAPPPFAPSLTSRLPQLETLFKAAFLGQLRLLKKAVRKLDEEEGEGHVGAVRDSSGLSVLHLATLSGTKPVCKYLVEELQLDVDTIDARGGTPLTTAICLGHLDVVSYLLDHGADTEKLNDDGDGFPALQLAAREGKCEMVELLLSKGAYIDATTKGGTALHAAARAGRDDIVKDFVGSPCR